MEEKRARDKTGDKKRDEWGEKRQRRIRIKCRSDISSDTWHARCVQQEGTHHLCSRFSPIIIFSLEIEVSEIYPSFPSIQFRANFPTRNNRRALGIPGDRYSGGRVSGRGEGKFRLLAMESVRNE